MGAGLRAIGDLSHSTRGERGWGRPQVTWLARDESGRYRFPLARTQARARVRGGERQATRWCGRDGRRGRRGGF